MRKTFSILGLLLLSCGLARAEGSPMNVTLKGRASLNVETVRVRDLIDAENTDLDFIKKFGSVEIGIGEDAAEIDHSTVLAALLNAGANLDEIRFSGGIGVVLERGQKIRLPQSVSSVIASLLNSAYGVPPADVTVSSARVLPKLPSTDLAGLKFSGLAAEDVSDLNRARFKVVIEDESGERTQHALFLNLTIETAAATAAAGLEAGQTLIETDYVAGRTPLKALSGRIIPISDLKERPHKILSNVRKDEVLTDENIAEIQQIKKGTPVTLSYKTGPLSIQATGTLADDAEIGATVQVENSDSKRLVTGRLVKKDEVEVGYAN